MKDFTIQVNEKEDYGKRTNKSFLINLAFSLVIGFVAGYESEWSYGLGFGLLFFAIQFFKSNRWDKYYILSIIINENKIELTYNENNEKKFLKDDCVFFEFKKKSAISK